MRRAALIGTLCLAAATACEHQGRAAPRDGVVVERFPSLTVTLLALRVDQLPGQLERQALSLALDRQEIAAAATARPATGMVPPGFGPPATFISPSPDMVTARRALEAATDPPRRVGLLGTNDAPTRAQMVSIADAWRKLGIDTEIRAVGFTEFVRLVSQPLPDDVDAIIVSLTPDYPHPRSVLSHAACRSPFNLSGWCDRKFGRLLERGAYGEAELYLLEHAAMVPLAWPEFVYVHRESVRGLHADPFGIVDLTRISIDPDLGSR